jgi:hypothetical protein
LAAACGSTPWVFAPSVSTTMTSAAYAFAGRVAGDLDAGRRHGRVDVRDRVDRGEDRLADRGAAGGRQVRQRVQQRLVSSVGGTRTPAIPANATSPIRAPPAAP